MAASCLPPLVVEINPHAGERDQSEDGDHKAALHAKLNAVLDACDACLATALALDAAEATL